jgi:hypothetical protein
VYRHYHGFASGQLRDLDETRAPTAKSVLYVLRTALTGAHLLRTGRLVTDLTALLDDYGHGQARALVEAKRAGERTPLDRATLDRWRDGLGRALGLLDEALAASPLPEEPRNRDAIEAWLVALRRASF